MTSACAIFQLCNGVAHRGRTFVFLVRIGLVVSGMATRTVRAISRAFPRRRIGIGGVATDASQIQAGVVVAWILAGRMPECQWRPRRSRMTDIAIARGSHMPGGFAGSRCAVVAGRATAGDTRMAKRRGLPGKCGVTDIARLCRNDVSHRLAGCCDAIVASRAGTRLHAGVIEQCRRPGGRGFVASIAIVRRGYMCRRLAGGNGAVMA